MTLRDINLSTKPRWRRSLNRGGKECSIQPDRCAEKYIITVVFRSPLKNVYPGAFAKRKQCNC